MEVERSRRQANVERILNQLVSNGSSLSLDSSHSLSSFRFLLRGSNLAELGFLRSECSEFVGGGDEREDDSGEPELRGDSIDLGDDRRGERSNLRGVSLRAEGEISHLVENNVENAKVTQLSMSPQR